MSDDRIPLNASRLAAIWKTAKLWSEDRCEGLYHRPGCKCLRRSPLSSPAMEMVEEIRRLRRLCEQTVKGSELVEGPNGPRVIIDYDHFKALAEVAWGDDWS